VQHRNKDNQSAAPASVWSFSELLDRGQHPAYEKKEAIQQLAVSYKFNSYIAAICSTPLCVVEFSSFFFHHRRARLYFRSPSGLGQGEAPKEREQKKKGKREKERQVIEKNRG
jgi:hypothetical protein